LLNNLEYLGFSNPMALAMSEALKVNPYPNPRVGSVLIDKHGNIKAISNHVKKGKNHAEINIFEQVHPLETDVLYVTLEPCFHNDTSPSCATEIINQGIKKIVIGDIDLDKRTNGKSISLLKENGLSVEIEYNANNLLNPYYKNMHTKLTDIHYLLKIGMSDNGFITNDSSTTKYITNNISLNIVHYLRASADCILVGKNTLLNDKPELNVRLNNVTNLEHKPVPIILWGNSTDLLEESMEKYPSFTFLSSTNSYKNNVFCSTSSLDEVEDYLLEKNFRNIIIEGGRNLLESYLLDNKIDSIYEFKSSTTIKKGLKLGDVYNEKLIDSFTRRSKYQLLDNFLTTYTKN